MEREFMKFNVIPPHNKLLEIFDEKHNIYYGGVYIQYDGECYLKIYDVFERYDIIVYEFENFLWKII